MIARSQPTQWHSMNGLAAGLSIMPGLGHIYKGHVILGLILLLFGMPAIVGLAILFAAGSMGVGLIIIPFYWLMVSIHAFSIKPRTPPLTKIYPARQRSLG